MRRSLAHALCCRHSAPAVISRALCVTISASPGIQQREHQQPATLAEAGHRSFYRIIGFFALYPSADIRVNYGDPVTGQTGRLFLPFDFSVGRSLTKNLRAVVHCSRCPGCDQKKKDANPSCRCPNVRSAMPSIDLRLVSGAQRRCLSWCSCWSGAQRSIRRPLRDETSFPSKPERRHPCCQTLGRRR